MTDSIFRLEWRLRTPRRATWYLISYHVDADNALRIAKAKNARAKANLPPWTGEREKGDKQDYTAYRYRVVEFTRKGVVRT